MKVGFLCGEYPTVVPSHGGIGSSVQTLSHLLVQAGHEAAVFSLGPSDGSFSDGAVQVRTIQRAGTWRSTLRMRRLLRDQLAGGALDLIESPESESHMLPGGAGSVVRLHGSHHFWCAYLDQERRLRRLGLEQLGVRRAKGLCAVSSFAAEATRRVMRLGSRNIEVLPNPVDCELFTPDQEAVVAGRVVFAGTVTEKKGIRELCEAIDALVPSWPELHLLALGRDSHTQAGESFQGVLLSQLSPRARERVTFLGAVPRTKVAETMRTAHVCAFPSYIETQGIVVGEALASGRPAIASERGPGAEVLGNPSSGWLVNPESPAEIAKALESALSDRAACDDLGEMGRKFVVERFSGDLALSASLRFYERHRKGRA